MAEMFSGMPGRFSELGETLEGFKSLLDNKMMTTQNKLYTW